jgi:hypothetical protein
MGGVKGVFEQYENGRCAPWLCSVAVLRRCSAVRSYRMMLLLEESQPVASGDGWSK